MTLISSSGIRNYDKLDCNLVLDGMLWNFSAAPGIGIFRAHPRFRTADVLRYQVNTVYSIIRTFTPADWEVKSLNGTDALLPVLL